jgi:hypothetical protein
MIAILLKTIANSEVVHEIRCPESASTGERMGADGTDFLQI